MIKFREPVFYRELTSTNTFLLENDFPDGTVIVAESQTAGRGRRSRKWHSPPGKNLYFSILLRDPGFTPLQVLQLNLVTAVAIVKALEEEGIRASIKWPNDILLNEKKLGGILIESEMESNRARKVVIGIGLNVNMTSGEIPPELSDIATSIKIETGRETNLTELLKNLLQKLQLWYNIFKQEGFNHVKNEWENYFSWMGKEVVVYQDGFSITGIAERIDESGFLIIRDKEGRLHRIIVGDVSLRRRDVTGN